MPYYRNQTAVPVFSMFPSILSLDHSAPPQSHEIPCFELAFVYITHIHTDNTVPVGLDKQYHPRKTLSVRYTGGLIAPQGKNIYRNIIPGTLQGGGVVPAAYPLCKRV